MQATDLPEFCKELQEVASMYRGTIYNDFFASAYWKVLRPFAFEAVHRAFLDVMGNEVRKPGMPSAAEIKTVARKFEPKRKPLRVSNDEERWRRRYDVWQRGIFSDDALRVAFVMTDEELGLGGEGEETFIRCQGEGCVARIPWPSEENALHCRQHRSEPGKAVTRREKIEIAKSLTPSGRAYLRSILPELMADIAVTEDEAKLHVMPRTDLPTKLVEYLATVDQPTAERIVENFHTRTSPQDEQARQRVAAGVEG